MTADILQEVALDSNSHKKRSDTAELADCLPNESDSKSNGAEGETIDQQSTSTGQQILMKSVSLQKICPFTRWPLCFYHDNHNYIYFPRKK